MSGGKDPSSLDFSIPSSSLYPEIKTESVRKEIQNMLAKPFSHSPPHLLSPPFSPIPSHVTSVSSHPAHLNSPSSSSTSSPLLSSAVKRESGLDSTCDNSATSSKIVLTFNRQNPQGTLVKQTQHVKNSFPKSENVKILPSLPKVLLRKIDCNQPKAHPSSSRRFCGTDFVSPTSSERLFLLRPASARKPYQNNLAHGIRSKKLSTTHKERVPKQSE